MAELISCSRDHVAPKVENNYYLTLSRKSVVAPETGHRADGSHENCAAGGGAAQPNRDSVGS